MASVRSRYMALFPSVTCMSTPGHDIRRVPDVQEEDAEVLVQEDRELEREFYAGSRREG